MYQTWHNLLFAHWPVPVAALRPLVPAGLTIDAFEGQTWISVVPFGMRRVYPRGAFPVPGLSDFLELNVRVYVTAEGKAGVFFFSLDAANAAAVALARAWYHLPYFNARMRIDTDSEGWTRYHSRRTHRGAPAAEFKGRYRPVGPEYRSTPGTLEAWLTDRYCLYAVDANGKLFRGDIHHSPWPLYPAEAEIEVNTMAAPHGVELAGTPLLQYVPCLEIVAWALTPLG
jgi:hypothetical protein